MDKLKLIPQALDLSDYRFGTPQRSGTMTVLPLFGNNGNGKFSSPLSGLKLSRVKGYGSVELENPSGGGTAIVPLHIGYIQDRLKTTAFAVPPSSLRARSGCLMMRAACRNHRADTLRVKSSGFLFFHFPCVKRR